MNLVNDLLSICERFYDNKKICYIVDTETERYYIPMAKQYYVADDIFFFELVWRNKEVMTTKDFVDMLENECENDRECWFNDLYVAPMEKVGNCELRIPKDMTKVIDKNVFDNCYDIVDIKVEDSEIKIFLK